MINPVHSTYIVISLTVRRVRADGTTHLRVPGTGFLEAAGREPFRGNTQRGQSGAAAHGGCRL